VYSIELEAMKQLFFKCVPFFFQLCILIIHNQKGHCFQTILPKSSKISYFPTTTFSSTLTIDDVQALDISDGLTNNGINTLIEALPTTSVPIQFDSFSVLLSSSPESIDVLGPKETLEGFVLGITLAIAYSFLQVKTGAAFFVPWQPPSLQISKLEGPALETANILSLNQSNTTEINTNDLDKSVFDEKSWKEISRPENYIFYNRKISKKDTSPPSWNSFSSDPNKSFIGHGKNENKLVIVGLLLLFVPIFTIEFFFALSRQFMCGIGMNGIQNDPFTTSSWAMDLCSAHLMN